MPAKFNTITGSDWRVSLIAALDLRTLNQIKIRNQITEAMKTTPRVQSSSRKKVGAKMLAAHADGPIADDAEITLAARVRELERENARLREAIKWAEPYVPKYSETYRMISELPNV